MSTHNICLIKIFTGYPPLSRLESAKGGGDDHKNSFMISGHESCLAKLGFKLVTLDLQSDAQPNVLWSLAQILPVASSVTEALISKLPHIV